MSISIQELVSKYRQAKEKDTMGEWLNLLFNEIKEDKYRLFELFISARDESDPKSGTYSDFISLQRDGGPVSISAVFFIDNLNKECRLELHYKSNKDIVIDGASYSGSSSVFNLHQIDIHNVIHCLLVLKYSFCTDINLKEFDDLKDFLRVKEFLLMKSLMDNIHETINQYF